MVQRGKGPLEHIVEATRRLAPATFLMRRQSEEPEPRPAPGPQDKSTSYDYSAEEREFQALAQNDQANERGKANAMHKRIRMSSDNKAYRPSQSDLEYSDEDFEDDGKRTKKKKKKFGAVGGPLTSLPVAGYDKRKKKRRGTKGNGLDGEEEESSEEEGQSYEQVADEVSICGTRGYIKRRLCYNSDRRGVHRFFVRQYNHHHGGQCPEDRLLQKSATIQVFLTPWMLRQGCSLVCIR